MKDRLNVDPTSRREPPPASAELARARIHIAAEDARANIPDLPLNSGLLVVKELRQQARTTRWIGIATLLVAVATLLVALLR